MKDTKSDNAAECRMERKPGGVLWGFWVHAVREWLNTVIYCRGGSEENKLQLVNIHTRGSTEEATAVGKRGGGGEQRGHGVFAFRHYGYSVPTSTWEKWDQSGSALYLNLIRVRECKNCNTLSQQQERYWPTTPGPPLHPPRSPHPQRRSARLGCRLHSCRWLSLVSASASDTETSTQTDFIKHKWERHWAKWIKVINYP